MTTYNTNKPAVRDSFDDDDVSDDVDDEVFIRDGRNGFKMDEERGMKRPLMAPRRKTKNSTSSQFHPEVYRQPQCRAFCIPCCYALLALAALFGLVSLVVIIINMFPFPLESINIWSKNVEHEKKVILPCIDLKSHKIWVKTFPKLTSEAAVKVNDVNGDNVHDVIVGYGTGADNFGLGDEVCPSYMPGVPPSSCLGGVMALDGRSGSVLWQHWTHRSVLFVDCSTDITADKTNDCIISGKGGVLSALNGRDGKVIWELKKPPNKEEVDVYAVQFISDVDFDLVPDILATHTSIQSGQSQGHLLILSGRTSSVLSQVPSPNYESVFSHSLVTVRPDGSSVLLLATGGGLYAIPLLNLVSGNISQSLQLIKGGVNEAPVLVDLNKDGTEDIVAISETRVTAIDGLSLEEMWNVTSTSLFGKIEILNSPTPAYFNDDDIPDLLFTLTVGSSYPEYYFSQTTVIDGRTGQLLLDQPIVSSSFVDVPGLSLSMAGSGNDFYLYWVAVCVGHEGAQQRFSFLNSTPIKQRAQSDLCRLRFNSTVDIRLYAFSQHTAPPGLLVYSSEHLWVEEHNTTWNMMTADNVAAKKDKWPQPPESLTSFHHKGDSMEHLRTGPHHSHSTFNRPPLGGEDIPVTLDDYERISQRRPHVEWHPQESAYGSSISSQNQRYSNLGMYGILNGALPELETAYNREAEENQGPVFSPNTLDRDERALLDRPKRNIQSKGLPHVGSPGALIPSLDLTSVDLIVTTHWLPAADNIVVRLPVDDACMQAKLSQLQPTEKFPSLEAFKANVEETCLLERGVSPVALSPNVPLGSSLMPFSAVSPSNSQLTVTRLGLMCTCDLVSAPEQCTHTLPYTAQSWTQRGPNVYYKPRVSTHAVLA